MGWYYFALHEEKMQTPKRNKVASYCLSLWFVARENIIGFPRSTFQFYNWVSNGIKRFHWNNRPLAFDRFIRWGRPRERNSEATDCPTYSIFIGHHFHQSSGRIDILVFDRCHLFLGSSILNRWIVWVGTCNNIIPFLQFCRESNPKSILGKSGSRGRCHKERKRNLNFLYQVYTKWR